MSRGGGKSSESPELGLLLTQLSHRGIAVGASERLRLQRIFATQPVLGRGQLVQLLQNVLAKDEEQRQLVGSLFDQCYPEEKPDLSKTGVRRIASTRKKRSQTAEFTSEGESEPEERPNFPALVKIGALLLLLLGLGMLVYAFYDPGGKDQSGVEVIGPDPSPVAAKPPKKDKHTKSEHPLQLIDYVDLWEPVVTVVPNTVAERMQKPMLLLLASALGWFLLWRKSQQVINVRRPKSPRIQHRGKRWMPANPGPLRYQLLDGDARREMSWGVGRYLTDETLQTLDVERSVDETAKTGLPTVHFRNAVRDREVWLWQDRASDNSDIVTLAEEISSTLSRHNIVVERGFFDRLPDAIKNGREELIWSIHREPPDHQPLVLLLMDAEQQSSKGLPDEQMAQRCFDQLSHWENLAVVDCGEGQDKLCPRLSSQPLDCLAPVDVSRWIANRAEWNSRVHKADSSEDLHLWAVACALPEWPVSEEDIRDIHASLGLQSLWQYPALKTFATQTPQGYNFVDSPLRVQLLETYSSLFSTNPSMAQAISSFWSDRLQTLERRRKEQQTTALPWEESKAQRKQQIEASLLKLWDVTSVNHAVTHLFDNFHNKRLKKTVANYVVRYRCRDWQIPEETEKSGVGRICLPFEWNALSAESQQKLLQMGFGGQPAEDVPLVADRLTQTGQWLLAGVAMTALGMVVHAEMSVSNEPTWSKDLPHPDHAVIQRSEGEGGYLIAEPKSDYPTAIFGLEKEQLAKVYWTREWARPAREEFGGKESKSERWLVGTKRIERTPDSKCKGLSDENCLPPFSVAVIQYPVDHDDARRLAAKLLDSGSVDQVLFGEDVLDQLTGYREKWADIEKAQWWYFLPERPPVLDLPKGDVAYAIVTMPPGQIAAAMQTEGFVAAGQLNVGPDAVRNTPLLVGTIDKRIEMRAGPTLVYLPVGEFRMGGNHLVKFSNGRYMSETEVTFDQYDSYLVSRMVEAFRESKLFEDIKPSADELLETKQLEELRIQKRGNDTEIVIVPKGEESDATKMLKIIGDGLPQQLVSRVISEVMGQWLNLSSVESKDFLVGMALSFDPNRTEDPLKPFVDQVPKDEGWRRRDRPVINVSWNQARDYAQWLSEENDRGLVCRLPSEAEWEYAARAGTTRAYFWGDEIGKNNAVCGDCGSEWDGKQTAPVKSFKANAFGLYDMHGNVWEWVEDCWHNSYEGAPKDGAAWVTSCSSESRVLRGGSWSDNPGILRSAYRLRSLPDDRVRDVGFRVVCSLPSSDL